MNVFLDLGLLCCGVGLLLQALVYRRQWKIQIQINEALQGQIVCLLDVLKTLAPTGDDKSLEQALRLQGAAGEKK